MALNIGIFVYDGAEVLDFSGPFEVFSTANRMVKSDPPFNPFLVGQTQHPVCARGNFQVLPAYSFKTHPNIDVLMVSGGNHSKAMQCATTLEWLSRQNNATRVTASVCTGVFLLAAAGVLSNQQVTTHWQDIKDLQLAFPNLKVHPNRRWVHDDKFMTSAGISAGIDMSLHLVEQLSTRSLAIKTAQQMDYERTMPPLTKKGI